MHPIVIYQLVKTRMELDRQAERRRLAQAEMPRMQRVPASSGPQRKRWRDTFSSNLWHRAWSRDRSQPSSAGDIDLVPAATGSRRGSAHRRATDDAA